MSTSERLLCSVVTGTWGRHDLLLDLIANVRLQTYRPIEHCIVSEGLDPELRQKIDAIRSDDDVPIRFVELGRNWTGYIANSRNAAPMIVAQLLAGGVWQTWAADDERMTPDHIESLVDLLEAESADFVYSQTDCYWVGRPQHRWIIGTDPPQCGQITNVLYRAKLLEKGLTRLGADPCPDWDQIGSWVAAGAKWAYLPRVTFEHRADQ